MRLSNQGWRSGKVASNAQAVVVPAALDHDTLYSWQVRVWLSNAPAAPTAWGCGAATFETAPAPATFPGKAQWVGGGGQLRSKLSLPAGAIRRAIVRATGVGAFYLFVNGRRVGHNIMDPPQTVYSKTVLYSTFDVADLLVGGSANSVGALLGTYKFGYTDQVEACVATPARRRAAPSSQTRVSAATPRRHDPVMLRMLS